VDILVLATDETVIASVQVKTRTYGADGGWHMSVKHESIIQQPCFYTFVDLEPDVPVTYVVPSRVVAEVLRVSHKAWLSSPGRGGRAHRDHDLPRIVPNWPFAVEGYPNGWIDEYRESWALLAGAVGTPGDAPNG
jgi:hypothetical protein